MRDRCPVCESPEYRHGWKMRYLVPDGWELPTENRIYCCDICGMIWYDNDRTQSDYDAYYRNRYGGDGALSGGLDSHQRQDELINIICGMKLPHNAAIVDFGGGKDRYIERKLRPLYSNVMTVDIGDPLPRYANLIVLSEVLEHVYDLAGVMEKLMACKPRAFLVEVPDAERTVTDYHQKHINHFPPMALDMLFELRGMMPIYQERRREPFHFGYVYRAIYVPAFDPYKTAHDVVMGRYIHAVETLKSIDQPVIVWGCSDTALHLLAEVKLDVVHYVDKDPAFRGATIGGVPVLDHVESDAPIVIMAHNQRQSILMDIQEAGLRNEVIPI